MPYPAISPSFHVRLTLSDYGEEQLLRKLLGFSFAIPPTNWHAALGRYLSGAGTPFGEDGTGGSEPNTAWNYARAIIPRNSVTWTDPASNIQASYGGVPVSRVRSWLIPEIAWPEILVSEWDTGGDPEFLGLFDADVFGPGNCWARLSFVGAHLGAADIGYQYFIPEDVTAPGHTEIAVVLEDTVLSRFGVSWKIKFLDWLLRGIDFTAPLLYMGWVRRDLSTSPGTPNMVDETVVEVSTSGTGYNRHNVSASWATPTTVSGQTYAALNTTQTWNATGDWGFQCAGALFNGASGAVVAAMDHGLAGFFRPQNGDTVNVGPGVPGSGGCFIAIN
jgi:hypothetical protein